jgi:spermidine synthase
MSTEMGATRLLAPYFGTSQLIWANLIGFVLIYLTVGYVIGGRLADRYPHRSGLYRLTAWAGFAIVLIPIVARPLLSWSARGFAELSAGIFFGSLFSIILLFSVPLTLLGAVSPYAIRLRLSTVSEAGNAAGSLYALSTLGSFLGTLLPVLWLQPAIGTRAAIWVFGIVLLGISLTGLLQELGRRAMPYAAMLGAAILLVVVFNGGGIRAAEAGGTKLYEDESAYNYIQVVERDGWHDLILNEGQATHSRYNPLKLLTGGPWDYFLLAPLWRPDGLQEPVRDMLMIGLAGGTVSNQYAEVYPRTRIDGVEIDGQIVDVGRKYFRMDKPQLNVEVADGRYFLLTTQKRYDVVGIDAYRQPYVPFHLATKEFFEQVREKLTPNGVVVINAGRAGNDYRLVEAMGSTMGSVFPSVFIIDTERYSNSLVYATNVPMTVEQFKRNALEATDPHLREVVSAALNSGNIRKHTPSRAAFTDDLAPVEQVIDQIILNYALDQGN